MSLARSGFVVALVAITAISGCGGAPQSVNVTASRAPAEGDGKLAPASGAGVANPAEPPLPVPRKIIYTAQLEVVVKDLDAGSKELERLVAEWGGYIAKSDRSGNLGSRRTATWTLKVPSEKFRTAVNSLAGLGVATRNTSDSQDVTEEFVDIQARVKNLKIEEEALNKMIAEPGLNLESRIRIRSEISRVRGDIERAEGRMKYLATMSAMSTITVTLSEESPYVPPTVPTFASRVDETFDGSLTALSNLGKGAALVVIALAPWSPLILLAGIGARLGFRNLQRGHSSPRPRLPVAAVVAPSRPSEG